VRTGDETARNRLLARYLPRLRRWAHGRLPANARSLEDTDDLVQETLLRALRRLDQFEVRWEGAFLAYLRRILQNRIRDEIRHLRRSGTPQALTGSIPDRVATPLEKLIGQEAARRYEVALEQLTELQREAFVMRIEMGFSHRQVAHELGSTTDDAARMLVARALARMATLMGRDDEAGMP
jgi:RNA polymerase sigma-70 factor (ECF subfamily)